MDQLNQSYQKTEQEMVSIRKLLEDHRTDRWRSVRQLITGRNPVWNL